MFFFRPAEQLSHHPNQGMRDFAPFWTRTGVCFKFVVCVTRTTPGPAQCFLEGDIHAWVGEVVTPQDSVLEVKLICQHVSVLDFR